jgi:HK97 family phage major capsid protein
MPNKLAEEQSRRTFLVEKLEALQRKTGDEDRDLTPEEKIEWDELTADCERTSNRIAREEEIIARNEAMSTTTTASQAVEVVQVGVDNVPQTSNAQPFESLGEQLVAVAKAGTPMQDGGAIDPRLAQVGFIGAASGLSEGVMSEGGALVQTDFQDGLMAGAMAESKVWSKAVKIPISGNASGVKIKAIDETSRADGSRWGGIRAYWVEEAGEITASKPSFRIIDLQLKKLGGLCYATEELLADAAALEAVVRQGFAEEFSFKLDDAAIRGSGAGRPQGILNATAKVAVAKETNQAAATVNYKNITKMWARCPARSRAKAVWFMNQEVEEQLDHIYMQTGTSGVAPHASVYVPAGVGGSATATLKGREVVPIEQCEAIGTEGDIVLADMSQYITCQKGGVKQAASMHVRFIYDELTFRWTLRVDGQPSWAAAMTPYKATSGSTLSPFVTLAVRA